MALMSFINFERGRIFPCYCPRAFIMVVRGALQPDTTELTFMPGFLIKSRPLVCRARNHKSDSVSGSLNVRFAPRATEFPHRSEMTLMAISGQPGWEKMMTVRL
jgi:hypothetical protein